MSLALLPDGKRLLGRTSYVDFHIWDAAGAREMGRLTLPGHSRSAHPLADGKTVACPVWADGQAIVDRCDVAAGQACAIGSFPTPADVTLAVAPASDRLALCGGEGVLLLSAGTGEVLRKFGPPCSSRAAAFSPDGGRLAAAGPARI